VPVFISALQAALNVKGSSADIQRLSVTWKS
jgi:hypothetical protein